MYARNIDTTSARAVQVQSSKQWKKKKKNRKALSGNARKRSITCDAINFDPRVSNSRAPVPPSEKGTFVGKNKRHLPGQPC